MRSLLILHKGSVFDEAIIGRWLAASTELTGIVVIEEKGGFFMKRLRAEYRRSGLFRMLDILAYRVFYRLFQRGRDQAWLDEALAEATKRWPNVAFDQVPTITVSSPNGRKAREFITQCNPEFVIARCKVILKSRIFEIPSLGTFVMHPGICPEYRNSHGCFWALAKGDLEKVGMTLLKIDRGVDTGPIYGHYFERAARSKDSHLVIQDRVVMDHLDQVLEALTDLSNGSGETIDVAGRDSGVWGQPWMSKYVAFRRNLKRLCQ